MFLFSFKNGNNHPIRISFDKYYIPTVEINNFITLINNKPPCDQPVKGTIEKRMKNLLKCQEMITIKQGIY